MRIAENQIAGADVAGFRIETQKPMVTDEIQTALHNLAIAAAKRFDINDRRNSRAPDD